jgi:phage-related minor tail protein
VEVICGDRNDLQDKINKATQNKDSHSPLLARIDEWQGTTIEKVKQVAEQARNEAKRLLDSKRTEITSQFEKVSKELVQIKETEDFVEQDLVRLKQTVHQLNQSLKELAQPPTIELRTEQSDRIEWNRLMYVEAKVSTITNQDRRSREAGE